MKRCSALLFIIETQIKIMRYHFTATRNVVVKTTTKENKCWQSCREIRTLYTASWECKIVRPERVENRLMDPQYVKHRIAM